MTGLFLLTGATGFVGRQLLRILSDRGFKVRVLIRAGAELKLETCDAIESVITTDDIFTEKSEWWASACAGVDTVIHSAWYAEPGKYLNSEKNVDCLIGTLHFAQGAAQAKVRRFVGIGTCFEYDLEEGYLSVSTPIKPLTPYAGTKAATFMALSQYLSAQNVEFTWCRLFYLFGEGEDARRLVPYLRSKLVAGEQAELTSGNQIRDFLDVSEAAQMIVDASLSEVSGAVNVCSGRAITIRQFVESIADEYKRRDLLKFGSRPDNFFDPACVVGIR